MEEIRKFFEESLEVIKKRANKNFEIQGFFTALCGMLKELESIAIKHLEKDDTLLKEITDLKKILCKDE